MKTIEQIAHQILRLAETGHEHQVNESLHFGMGLYAYSTDVNEFRIMNQGVDILGINPAFSHFNLDEQTLISFLQFLKGRDGYLAII